MRGGIGLNLGMRARPAAAALVEQDGAEMRRVEKAPHIGAAAAARSAMQHDDRNAIGIAAGILWKF